LKEGDLTDNLNDSRVVDGEEAECISVEVKRQIKNRNNSSRRRKKSKKKPKIKKPKIKNPEGLQENSSKETE